ncbi:plant VAMP (vesicle-associated membrane protein) family protein [Wolffia australiana]
MLRGDLISVRPLELKFLFELNKLSSCTMQLTNKTDQYVAFKIKTTNPKRYCVRPNSGIVSPGMTSEITVTMQAQKEMPPDLQCKDKFLVQSVVVENGSTLKETTSEMFEKAPGKVIEEVKLRVVYLPANLPSPVPEGSEEGSPPRSSSLDNGVQSAFETDNISRAPVEISKEKGSQVTSAIAKLTEEKNLAIQQNQKLRQELETLRKERKQQRGGFSLLVVFLLSLLGIFAGYVFKKC